VGPGLFRAWTDASPDTRRFSGGTVDVEISVGGTPARGFVLGGSVLVDKVFGLSSKDDVVNGNEPTLDGISFSLNALGVFADFYPDPEGGLDFHGFIGLGKLATTRPGPSNVDDPGGMILSGGVGYDWFVGRETSVGVHVRLTGGSLDVSETGNSNNTTTVTVLVPALLVAATYH
jgi:hypothetical protein